MVRACQCFGGASGRWMFNLMQFDLAADHPRMCANKRISTPTFAEGSWSYSWTVFTLTKEVLSTRSGLRKAC